jgi:hypothetical protein
MPAQVGQDLATRAKARARLDAGGVREAPGRREVAREQPALPARLRERRRGGRPCASRAMLM